MIYRTDQPEIYKLPEDSSIDPRLVRRYGDCRRRIDRDRALSLGVMLFQLVGLPAPVAMLFLAVAAKLCSAASPRLRSGGLVVYRFVRIGMTYPLLFAIGVR